MPRRGKGWSKQKITALSVPTTYGDEATLIDVRTFYNMRTDNAAIFLIWLFSLCTAPKGIRPSINNMLLCYSISCISVLVLPQQPPPPSTLTSTTHTTTWYIYNTLIMENYIYASWKSRYTDHRKLYLHNGKVIENHNFVMENVLIPCLHCNSMIY